MFTLKQFSFFLTVLFPLIASANPDLSFILKELDSKHETTSKENSLELLNVSYDPTREFYEEYNPLFINWWKQRTGQDLTVIQSHGGSGKQARAIIAGLEADVASLALAFDIDSIQNLTGVVGKDWHDRLPNNNSPYYSTIVFLVRKGNPKGIKNWDDLARDGVSVVMPNPKTSGGARWAYLAAWAWALETFNGDLSKTKEFMKKMFANTPVLDTGARGSTTSFIQRNMGDVLLTWENEAYLTIEKTGDAEYEIIYPTISIKAEPPVTWLEKNVNEKGTADAARFYLMYLYTPESQQLIAKHYFRPVDNEVAKQYESKFPKIKMVSVSDFGGWDTVQKTQFSDGGIFDEVYLAGKEKHLK